MSMSSSSVGTKAASQLMQANQRVVSMSVKQIEVNSAKMDQVKNGALQQTATEASAASERKGNIINVTA